MSEACRLLDMKSRACLVIRGHYDKYAFKYVVAEPPASSNYFL